MSIWAALCACLVVTGLVVSSVWMTRPGSASPGPESWPLASTLGRSGGMYTLLVFVHPHCTCTAATLQELGRIMSRCQARVNAQVVFSAPPGAPEDWVLGDLWTRAGELTGVAVVPDPGGVEARRFGAWTSGATYLYDSSGALLFMGGITSSRGHEGDNAGRSAVVAHVLGSAPGGATTPVYGCALFGDGPSTSNRALREPRP